MVLELLKTVNKFCRNVFIAHVLSNCAFTQILRVHTLTLGFPSPNLMGGHKEPQGECLICCEDLDSSNYAEYRAHEESEWMVSPYCSNCLESYFKQRQWEQYLDHVHKADCAAALRRILNKPVPTNVRDKGLPCDNENGEVYQFWYASEGLVSAKLENAPEGSDRDTFILEMQEMLEAFRIAEENE